MHMYSAHAEQKIDALNVSGTTPPHALHGAEEATAAFVFIKRHIFDFILG